MENPCLLPVNHAKRGLTKEIARITHIPRPLHETVRRYNQEGREHLRDKRHQSPPPDGGLGAGPNLRDWVGRERGKGLSPYPIYRLLHEMGFSSLGICLTAKQVCAPPRAQKGGGRGAGGIPLQVQEARAEEMGGFCRLTVRSFSGWSGSFPFSTSGLGKGIGRNHRWFSATGTHGRAKG